jgi:hypothetical protein
MSMHGQIEKALEGYGSMNHGAKAKFSFILKKYVSGDIGLDETYYQLLEDELIPMPSRCGMFSEAGPVDEKALKERIIRIISV